MACQIIIGLCEGPHDVAFLNKILKTAGFKSNEKCKLESYPTPMNNLLVQEAKKADVEGLNIHTVRQRLIPSNALLRGDIHILLYVMGGDAKALKRKEIIENIKNSIILPGEIKAGRENFDVQFGVIYFFDADDMGVTKRLAKVKDEISEVLTGMSDTHLLQNGSFEVFDGIKIGCYVFTEEGKDVGKLEDILMPIMRRGNEDIFEEAASLLERHHDDKRLFPLKLSFSSLNIVETRSNKSGDKYKYDANKSIIGTIGQLQQSGGSNTVCIGFTDYLTLEKILSDSKCSEVRSFVEEFVKM